MLQTVEGSPREIEVLKATLVGLQQVEAAHKQAQEKATIALAMFVAAHGISGDCTLIELTETGVTLSLPDPTEGETDAA